MREHTLNVSFQILLDFSSLCESNVISLRQFFEPFKSNLKLDRRYL